MSEKRSRASGILLRLDEGERQLLEALAGNMGLKLSDAARQAIREAARKRGLDLPGAPSRKQRP